jgi:hypothetical protein
MNRRQLIQTWPAVAALVVASVLGVLARFGDSVLSVHGPLFLLALPGLVFSGSFLDRVRGPAFHAVFFAGNVVAWYLVGYAARWVWRAAQGKE